MRIEIKNPNIVVKASNPSIVIRISGVPTVPGNPIPTADNDFIVGTSLGIWLKKTLAQVKIILGLGSAAYIDLDANNRFVTDTEKGTWNAKQPAGSYLVASDITGKVDKITGSSLVADTELTKLQHRIKFNFLK